VTARRLASNAAAAVAGALVGGLVVLAVEGATRDLTSSPPPVDVISSGPELQVERSPAPRVDPRRTIMLAWAPGGLPPGTERAVEKLPGVMSATTVRAGLDWIRGSRASDGSVLDDPPDGMEIPFEIAIVEPAEYAQYVPPSEREAVLALTPGRALLAQTSSVLRGGGSGMKIAMDGGRVVVSDVVSDVTTQGYEALLSGPVPDTWQRTDTFVLMRVDGRAGRRAIAARITRMLAPGQTLRLRAQGETPFLRYGDAVLPQLHIKSAFGEFAAAPRSNGTIAVSPAWHRRNITAMEVPILGTITCHRGLFPQLRHALDEIQAEGLAFTIDAGDFGGCYSGRFIDSNPGGRLSHHSWGIAVDLNVGENRPGTRPDQDPRIIRIMERNGFTWGGRWLVPDGMHFEWVRFP